MPNLRKRRRVEKISYLSFEVHPNTVSEIDAERQREADDDPHARRPISRSAMTRKLILEALRLRTERRTA